MEVSNKNWFKTALQFLNASVVPVSTLIFAWIIIRNYGAVLWGEFIVTFLWMNVAAYILSFGSKEFLLRIFSREPDYILENWKQSLSGRTPLLMLFIILLFVFPVGAIRAGWITLWLVSRFIYQSYEPLNIYQENKWKTLISELLMIVFLFFLLVLKEGTLSVTEIIKIYAIAETIKLLLIIALNSSFLPLIKPVINFTELKNAFPFFLTGFTGFIQLRADQLVATFILPASSMAFYQILMSILLLLQSIAYLIIQPFLKKIYTISMDAISSLSFKLLTAGALILPVVLFMVRYILINYYGFSFDVRLLVPAYLFVLPFYYFIPFIYVLYKLKEERTILYINIFIIILSIAVLPYLFIHSGILAVIIFIAALQIIQAVVYRRLLKKIL